MNQTTEHDDEGDTEVSRSHRRREALAIFKLAEALVELSPAALAKLPLADDLRDEVAKARAITQQIARKRQTQFLAKQLRRIEDELEPIRRALDHDRDSVRRDTAALHRVEALRQRLIDGGDVALAELLNQFPHADRQRLRQLARQAKVEVEQNKNLHSFRELFRELRALLGGDSAPVTDEQN